MGSPLFVALRFETWERLKVSNGFGEAPLSGPEGVQGVLLAFGSMEALCGQYPGTTESDVMVLHPRVGPEVSDG